MEAVLAIEIMQKPQSNLQEKVNLKRRFFFKNRTIYFHINKTIVIRPVKRNQLSFPSTEINKPLLNLVQCLVDQIEVQKSIQIVATDLMLDHT